jgi:hypothetical protein
MKVTLNIPEGMHDISIAKYRQLQTAMESQTSDINKVCVAVACLCDVEEWVVKGMSQKAFEEVRNDLEWAMNPRDKWPLIPTTYIEGVEYGIIPDLTDISVGEFADLDKLVQDGKTFDNLEKVMSILYRPITDRWKDYYDIEPYNPKPKHAEIMKSMTMDVALGAVVFFWRIAEMLAKDSVRYSGLRKKVSLTQ